MLRSVRLSLCGVCACVAFAVAGLSDVARANEGYCDNQRAICRTLCSQVTPQGSSRRQTCDSGCERSAGVCQSTGSFNFAPVEQFTPEFHRQ